MDAGRRGWWLARCGRLILLTVFTGLRLGELERRHRLTQIGDAPLEIRSPRDQIVDLRLRDELGLGVGLQRGVDLVEEGLN